jgi:hypothetical protein
LTTGEVKPNAMLDPAHPEREKFLAAAAMPGAQQLSTINPLLADQPAFAERVAFDWRQLQVWLDGGDWKLGCGGYTIANFGPYLLDARRALDVLQFYRCNEHCLVGRPAPVCSFFLCAGQAPRGGAFGLHGQSFRPDDVTVRKIGMEWSIGDAHQTLLLFGQAKADAKTMLRIIQEKKFDLLAYIGAGNSRGMTILVRTQWPVVHQKTVLR